MAKEKELASCFKKMYVTPQGEASYPHIAEPQTKFNEDGVYDVTMYFDEQSGGKLLEQLNDAYNQASIEAKEKYEEQKPQYKKDNPQINYEPFYREEVDDDGVSTGRIFVKFKCKAKIKTRDNKIFEKKVAIYDRYNQPMPNEKAKKVSSGSIMKVAFKASPYFVPAGCKAGISLQLEAVQVIEAKEWDGTRSAADYGFKSFEDEDGAAFGQSEGDIDF